jgi:lipid II:glycine glycyltransferase (peptidoglycan interpeptide bridge formation enzyme)
MFKVIDNKEEWKNILKNFNHLDCYYSYEYGNLFSKIEHGKLFAAYYEGRELKIFYPFIKRRVPFVENEYFDIVTPYGYGGPAMAGKFNGELILDFYEIFSSYCRLQNIVTETIRFHPLYHNDKIYKTLLETNYIRKTIAIDLTASLNEIRSNYSPMNKRNIRRAKKNSLTCFLAEDNEENINVFMEMYQETMERNHATSYYYFDKEYFNGQTQATDLSQTLLLFVKWNDEIIAGVLVLVGKQFSHYHLGASKTKYLDLKPNNLLFDFMIETCKLMGSKILHLGGGYQENDGLFKFKSSFANTNHYEYYLGKKVHLPELYNRIVADLKEDYELDESYFPIYRAQIKEKKIHVK